MTKEKRGVDLTEGSVGKRLLLYFLPILAGSLFQQLYSTVDAVILGQFAGKTGLAAIDAVYSFLKLPVNFFVGLSAGTTILISQFFGARDNSSLSKAVHTGICFALAGGLALSVLGFLVAPLCLKASSLTCRYPTSASFSAGSPSPCSTTWAQESFVRWATPGRRFMC